VLSPLDQCSANCGGGVLGRHFFCRDTQADNVMADAFCFANPKGKVKPADTAVCRERACDEVFLEVTRGACSKTCGGGTQSYQSMCMSAKGKLAEDQTLCSDAVFPPEQRPCNEQACPDLYLEPLYDQWPRSAASCAAVAQTRQLNCLDKAGGSRRSLPLSVCTAAKTDDSAGKRMYSPPDGLKACQNNGFCNEMTGMCACANGFGGTACEVAPSIVDDDDGFNMVCSITHSFVPIIACLAFATNSHS
jgi:hypothetical protein